MITFPWSAEEGTTYAVRKRYWKSFRDEEKAVHPRSFTAFGVSGETDSSQVNLRHPEYASYRCFLPDLTGFAAIRRVGPNSQHRNSPKEASSTRPLGGIQSR